MKKKLRRLGLTVIVLVLIWVIHYAWVSFPIISGFNAKQMCTCVFVSGRDQPAIDTSDLSMFPLNVAVNKVNFQDSSVTSTVLGMAKKKVIYRKGIGCTLINELTEAQIREQKFEIPLPPYINSDSVAWPMGDKTGDSISADINMNQLNATVAKAFTEPYKGKQ
jgi:hypothetical protein